MAWAVFRVDLQGRERSSIRIPGPAILGISSNFAARGDADKIAE
jgi:hypothetical protein